MRVEGGFRFLKTDLFNTSFKLNLETDYSLLRLNAESGAAIELTPGKFKLAILGDYQFINSNDNNPKLYLNFGATYMPEKVGVGVSFGNRPIFFRNEQTVDGRVFFKSGRISCQAVLQIPTELGVKYARILTSFQYNLFETD